MDSIAFDIPGYFDNLKSAGVSDAQAHAQAHALSKLIEEKLLTREYLNSRFMLF